MTNFIGRKSPFSPFLPTSPPHCCCLKPSLGLFPRPNAEARPSIAGSDRNLHDRRRGTNSQTDRQRGTLIITIPQKSAKMRRAVHHHHHHQFCRQAQKHNKIVKPFPYFNEICVILIQIIRPMTTLKFRRH